MKPRDAFLRIEGFAGWERQRCVVIDETATRYRVRAVAGDELRFPSGRHGVMKVFANGSRLVLKTAITFEGDR